MHAHVNLALPRMKTSFSSSHTNGHVMNVNLKACLASPPHPPSPHMRHLSPRRNFNFSFRTIQREGGGAKEKLMGKLKSAHKGKIALKTCKWKKKRPESAGARVCFHLKQSFVLAGDQH